MYNSKKIGHHQRQLSALTSLILWVCNLRYYKETSFTKEIDILYNAINPVFVINLSQ